MFSEPISILKGLLNNLDNTGEIDELDRCREYMKRLHEDNNNDFKDLYKLFKIIYALLDGVKSSYQISKSEYQSQLINVRRKAQETMIQTIQAVRMESRNSVGTLQQQIQELQGENMPVDLDFSK